MQPASDYLMPDPTRKAPRPERTSVSPETQGENRIVVSGVTWGGYCAVRELLDRAGLRMAYLDGELEIMSPSKRHEDIKKRIARLLEFHAGVRGLRFYAYGSTTFRAEAKARGLEPDECYCTSPLVGDVPELAIEVVLSSGGVDKLAIYAGLGVPEVWFWQNDGFRVWHLEGDAYQPATASAVLPWIDIARLADHVRMDDQVEAVAAYLAYLRE